MSPKQSLQEQFGYVPPPKLTYSSQTDTPLSSSTKCFASVTTATPVDDISAAQSVEYDDNDSLDELVQLTDECRGIDSDFFNLSDDDEIVMDSGRLVPTTTVQADSDKTLSSYSDSRGARHSFQGFPYTNKKIVLKDSSYQVSSLQTNHLVPVSTWSDLPFPGGCKHDDRQGSLQHQIDQQPLGARAAVTHTHGASLDVSQISSFCMTEQRASDTVSQIKEPLSVEQTAHHDDCDTSIVAFFTPGPVR